MDSGEIISNLGSERGSTVAEYFGVTEKGNFEHGSSILHRQETKDQFGLEIKGILSVRRRILQRNNFMQLFSTKQSKTGLTADGKLNLWTAILSISQEIKYFDSIICEYCRVAACSGV
jgi:uncharacterized protein YyaL (SSP411 family)